MEAGPTHVWRQEGSQRKTGLAASQYWMEWKAGEQPVLCSEVGFSNSWGNRLNRGATPHETLYGRRNVSHSQIPACYTFLARGVWLIQKWKDQGGIHGHSVAKFCALGKLG